ncbi:reverse transcriptase domain-containing protein [Leucobacter sp. gxy201]|uniref:reverse transcriptase domain-containing protein n=1 Tax=Leucobacter sp. gxy201 TaxID=2957200 RepID=UPI003DA143EA
MRTILAPQSLISSLNLGRAAQLVVSKPLLDLPQLISERAFFDNDQVLADITRISLGSGLVTTPELLAMPKKSKGNRPLAVLSPTSRVTFEALVDLLKNTLPPSTRETDFQAFESFGTSDHAQWVASFDIAACYEFIDHALLAEELMLQGATVEQAEFTRLLLGSLFTRPIGLPQGVNSSHRLADLYLNRMERGLVRKGFEVMRYADDFKLILNDEKDAYQAIEVAMEEARRVHLALAEHKSEVVSSAELASTLEAQQTLFNEYTERVSEALTKEVLIEVGYEDWDVQLEQPSSDKVNFEAVKELISDWGDPNNPRSSALAHAGSAVFTVARDLPERVPNELLAGLVDKEPIRLRRVVEYARSRPSESENWELLELIQKQKRNTPWHRLWLLQLAMKSLTSDSACKHDFLERAAGWVEHDASESVRAEAAWLLAEAGQLSSDALQNVYLRATQITEAGIAAVAGKLSQTDSSNSLTAIKNDSAQNHTAYEWGARQ